MTADETPDADAKAAADATGRTEAASLDAHDTVEAVGEALKPKSPIENLKSSTPMPGDSLLTKVMKVITNWT